MAINLLLSVFAFSALQAGSVDAAPSSKLKCPDITAPHVPGAVVKSISSRAYRDRSVTAAPPNLLQDVHSLHICEVNVTLSHEGENDVVHVQTWLPLEGWNSRFLAVGGGAWAAGLGTPDLALPASQDGTVNTGLLANFASRSVHDMAVAGKAVAQSFYHKPAKHAYFNGCSTGGRQGIAAAQRYPNDFDGILSGAPAIYWTQYVIAELWPQVVMKESGHYLSACERQAFRNASIKACDEQDGIKDGVIKNPFNFHFNPSTLVGQNVQCGESSITISQEAANVVSQIWSGPVSSDGKRLWYGMLQGASLDALANTNEANGTSTGVPFFVADGWARYFVKADPSFDTSALDSNKFESLFIESRDEFSHIMDSSDPNMRPFEQAGGKLLMWHGLEDQLIHPQGSIRYVNEVKSFFAGPSQSCKVDDFLRLFLVPGVDHCGYANTHGAALSDPFGALVNWVERKKAPEQLHAKTPPTAQLQFTRKVCQYPFLARFNGKGNPSDARSYSCKRE
ncbi:putative feruloyl esterase [Fusarium culmorum]|uniref:Carboxylic ester hydrolase n=1 Tax=Fusarium culmorum TaxID=5516 RepID=A0A2T4GYK5_FUSCU|nr:putative feruloyl esterase [Fusarium culmorum]